MRYPLKLEVIGDDKRSRLMGEINRKPPTLRSAAWAAFRVWDRSWYPYVARITGATSSGRLRREYLKGLRDYSLADDKLGKRGIFLYYWLEPGIYEISHRLSVVRGRLYFARVVDHQTLIEMEESEVHETLRHLQEIQDLPGEQ